MSQSIETINPANGQKIASYVRSTKAEVDDALSISKARFAVSRTEPSESRSALIRRLGEALQTDFEIAASNITTEMGKPIRQARGEVQKCIDLCFYYADRFQQLLARHDVATDSKASYVQYEPLGPILGIMPWNFPYWQVFRWGIPTLTVGNTLVLKHADNVQGTANHIAKLFCNADAPEGTFASLCLANDDVRPVIDDPRIRGVSLTGSVRAGRAVASAAAAMIKPTVLELGGSDPCLILADADLDQHMAAIVNARFQNTGQTCIAAKRYLVHTKIADEFLDRLQQAVADLKVGDPTNDQTDIGPLSRLDLHETLVNQVENCCNEGLKVIAGGAVIDSPGYFYAPTIVADVRPGSLPYREELFGPVATVGVCDSVEQMVEWANATDYGLSANVWTADAAKGEHVAGQLDAGVVFVNEGVKSDMRLPFGGIKDSGYGRELGGFGVHQFANAKTIVVRG